MSIPRWRIALTGVAIGVLAIAGIGLVNAGSNAVDSTLATVSKAVQAEAASNAEEAALDAALEAAPAAAREAADGRGANAGPVGRWVVRHLVHAVVTIQGEDDELYTIQLDRGAVTAVDADSLTIAEAGGSSVTVALNDATRVREGRERSNLDAIDVGDDVFVQSRIDGGTLAKRVFIIAND